MAKARLWTTLTAKPKLRPIRWAVSGLSWAFTAMAGWSSWLLQGERDRGIDELECLSLGAGRLGEHRDGGGGAGEADLVAGQGGQVLEQAAEAVVGLPGRVVLAGGLGLRGRRSAGGCDGVVPPGRVLIGEGQGRPGVSQVPGEVAGEHADQHVRLDAFLQPEEHRPQVQVVGFDVPEVPFHVFEVLIGGGIAVTHIGRYKLPACVNDRYRPSCH